MANFQSSYVPNQLNHNTKDYDENLIDEQMPSFAVLDLEVQSVLLQVPSDTEPAPPYTSPSLEFQKRVQINNNSVSNERDWQSVTRNWNHDLFGCLNDVPNCLLVCICPCVVEALVAIKARSLRLGMLLCSLSLLGYALCQVYYILLGSAVIEAELDTLDMIDARASGDSKAVIESSSPIEEAQPLNDEIIKTFARSFHSSGFWMASQFLSILIAVVAVLRILAALIIRIKARKIFSIGENDATSELQDALAVCCCYQCAMCQLKSTMDVIENENVFVPVNEPKKEHYRNDA